ncbi:MAG: cysteine-rich CWC family protein [Candidatus Accumulibacter sp.]|nr:cysteine-rich CWC family protein [Accumulibacter sp.]MCP5227924.1 cysteine-rich CWC family protein [Accumulibacter sp.]
MANVAQQALASTCPSCGTSFVCGAAAGLASCWCMEKPPLSVAPEIGSRCYCPTCLAGEFSTPAAQSSPAA